MGLSAKRLRIWQRSIAIAGSLIALLFVAARLDWSLMFHTIAKLSATSIAVCVAANVFVFLCIAMRWSIIVASDGRSIQFREVLIALNAYAFNLVTPAALGADIYRVADPRGREGGRRRSAGLVVFERCLGLLAQCFCYLVAWLAFIVNNSAEHKASDAALTLFNAGALSLSGLSVASICAVLALPTITLRFLGPIGWLSDMLRALINATRGTSAAHWPLLLLLSLAAVAGWITSGWALAADMGLELTFPAFTMIVIDTEFARLIPISIQGIGIREATFAWLSSAADATAEIGFAVCAGVYIVNNVVLAMIGLAAGVLIDTGRARADSKRETL